MRRRSFLASLAAFFGFGVATEARESETAWRLDRSDETIWPYENINRDLRIPRNRRAASREEIAAWNERVRQVTSEDRDMPMVTPKGTIFRCTNGHPICEAISDLKIGDANWPTSIHHWRQPEPAIGDPTPPCAQCGAQIVFWRNKRGINAL